MAAKKTTVKKSPTKSIKPKSSGVRQSCSGKSISTRGTGPGVKHTKKK